MCAAMATMTSSTTKNSTEALGLVPDWPLPAGVRSFMTTRTGGASDGVWSSFNLGRHVGDDPVAVAANRARLVAEIGVEPRWLDQVHGCTVVDAANAGNASEPPRADASFARVPGVACAVLTADCLPVLFCADDGSVVGAAHAGWRGLAAGVLEAAIEALGAPGPRLLAWLGPAIGPRAFEVGGEVREAFVALDPAAAGAFVAHSEGKWRADLYALARLRLASCGVERVFGGDACTFEDSRRFYSYRRDGQTGRMAALIWRV